MKKVLLVKSSFSKRGPVNPLGLHFDQNDLALGFLKSYAQKSEEINNNFEIEIYNFYLTGRPQEWLSLLKYIEIQHADIVCFSCFTWNVEVFFKVINALKELYPETLVVLGGPDIDSERFRVSGADVGVKGEGEVTFSELLKAILNKKDLSHIDGLIFRQGDKVIETPDRPLIENLDEIPSPYLSGALKPRGSAALELTRGCPLRCSYCFEGKNSPKVRFFSLERIKEELLFCAQNNLMVHCEITSTLNYNQKFFTDVLREIKRLQQAYGGPRLSSTLELSPAFPSEEIFNALKGVSAEVYFEIGMQSVDPEVLEKVHRPISKEKVKAFVDLVQSYGHKAIVDLMVGLPGESFFSHASAVYFCLRNNYYFNVSHTIVLPQTELASQGRSQGLSFSGFAPDLVLANDKSSFSQLMKSINFSRVIRKEATLRFYKPNEGKKETAK